MTSQRRWARVPAVVTAVTALTVLIGACGVSTSDENAMGDAYAASARQQLRLTGDSALVGSVARIGQRIAAVADTTAGDWHYYVVDDTIVNAFAIPGGHVFVFLGLLDRAESMAEVAGVLGHEVAHVALRHSVEQMQSRQRANVFVNLFCWVTGVCESTVAQVAIGLGGEALFAKYSRDDERAADSASVEYLVRAGIDPRGVPRFLERLLQARPAESGALESWFGSHPLEVERLARTEALIRRYNPVLLDALERESRDFPRRRGQ